MHFNVIQSSHSVVIQVCFQLNLQRAIMWYIHTRNTLLTRTQHNKIYNIIKKSVTETYPASMVSGYEGDSLGTYTDSDSGTYVGGSSYNGPSPPNNVDPYCPRIRKEWNTATDEERQLYIDAVLELSAQGILQQFVGQHSHMISDRQAHGTSAFLPWHRYHVSLPFVFPVSINSIRLSFHLNLL